ncbi:MAG TPA: helix-turn-helix domain-containing protein [Ktedonobacterales bacterium]|nr:helix-turn-helix domain-containing protein [Ktedonobacterales bacterium]
MLKLADGWDEAKIAETFAIAPATVKNVAHRFAEGGLDLVLHDKVQPRRRQALTGQQAAHLIAVACSPAPDGHDHWTMRLLAGKAVELGFVKSISPNTIHELLKKRAEALAARTLVSPLSGWGVCRGDGRRVGLVRRGVRSAVSNGLPG